MVGKWLANGGFVHISKAMKNDISAIQGSICGWDFILIFFNYLMGSKHDLIFVLSLTKENWPQCPTYTSMIGTRGVI